jgi:hypothetical protein
MDDYITRRKQMSVVFAEAKSFVCDVPRDHRDALFADGVKFVAPLGPQSVESIVAKYFALNSALSAVSAVRTHQKHELAFGHPAKKPFN